MLRRLLLAAAGAAVLFTAGLAQAQPSATLVLKSGERMQVQVIDHNARGLVVRGPSGERAYNLGEVALLDFRGGDGDLTATQYAKLTGGQHAVVLANGEVVFGKLEDIGGTQPLRITMQVDGTNRDYTSEQVQRIYFNQVGQKTPGAAATTGTADTRTITVPGNVRWVDTGLTVQKGQMVAFNAEGQISLSPAPGDAVGAAGSTAGRYPRGPMPNVLAGGLLGRIGRTEVFAIGNQTEPIPMPASGRLFLGVNDDEIADNTGAFEVSINPMQPAATPRR